MAKIYNDTGDIDAIHFKKTDKTRVGIEDSKTDPNDEYFTTFDESDDVDSASVEKEQKLQELSKTPDIHCYYSSNLATLSLTSDKYL